MKIETFSLNGEMHEGATDGKYRKARMNVRIASMDASGPRQTAANRQDLNFNDGYGLYATSAENGDMVNPGK